MQRCPQRTRANECSLILPCTIEVGEKVSDRSLSRACEEMLSLVEHAAGEKLFGGSAPRAEHAFCVQHNGTPRYPRFQFTDAGQPYAEMKAILAALPDRRGWDRLQWFLTPHALLGGRTPLEEWSVDRGNVVRAAQAERWEGRD